MEQTWQRTHWMTFLQLQAEEGRDEIERTEQEVSDIYERRPNGRVLPMYIDMEA